MLDRFPSFAGIRTLRRRYACLLIAAELMKHPSAAKLDEGTPSAGGSGAAAGESSDDDDDDAEGEETEEVLSAGAPVDAGAGDDEPSVLPAAGSGGSEEK